METNIILAGVGGQGILSISFVIDMAALKQGLNFKQAEVHGMSQRGGEVMSHLRVSDRPIHSDLVPKGRGTIVLSVEPLERLRYVDYLSPEGAVVVGTDPVVNIPDYPDLGQLLAAIASLPHSVLEHSDRLARGAGSARAQNMGLLGAASPYLGLKRELLEESSREAFARKGERIQKINLDAFQAGIAAGEAYRACRAAGIAARGTRALGGRLSGGGLEPDAIPLWRELLGGPLGQTVMQALVSDGKQSIIGTAAVPRAILGQGDGARDRLGDLLFGGSTPAPPA